MIQHCCDNLRLESVRHDAVLNGIDYIEVIDHDLPDLDPLRQRTLLVHCLKPVTGFNDANVMLSGGERIRNIEIQWAHAATPLPAELGKPGEAPTSAVVAAVVDPGNVLVVRLKQAGDYSTYTLALVRSKTDSHPPKNFDPRLAAIAFSFKVECPSEFDCKPQHFCPPRLLDPPNINYLARDYQSFRRLMLDRMAQIAPQWRESSVADYGIALVELLAFAGDQLSYQQDAVATEAYLETARRRISLRRHALLVDYPMDEGCNARAFVQIEVAAPGLTISQADTQFFTRCAGFSPGIDRASDDLRAALLLAPTVFEPLHAPALHAEHNKISFYSWGDRACCLPRGATSATLAGHLADLHPGDLLLFEEILGPLSGAPGDADPGHRHVVRLTLVANTDPDSPPDPLKDPLGGALITEIAWAKADALPFPVCVSATTDEAHGSVYLPEVSVARGNLVLVDHGRTIANEALGKVPPPVLFEAPARGGDPCVKPSPVPIPPRYRPRLARGPLTQAATVPALAGSPGFPDTAPPFDPSQPAAEAMSWSLSDVVPQATLHGTLGADSKSWYPHRTLLNSAGAAAHFVPEVDDDGGTLLRFGDGEHGLPPASGTAFTATYRTGNGTAGNVGAESIAHVVASNHVKDFLVVRNPLPARGGVDPESADSVRRNAPEAFFVQHRAVTPADYADVTERLEGVARAAARQRWTGSWYTMFLTVDPEADADAASLKAALPDFLDSYRMAGHDLEFNDPRYVSLEIDMHVCVKPDYFRSDVKARLLDALSSRELPGGRRGLFHPDNFSFGQSVYLSAIYAAAHAVTGVASVLITTFQHQGTDDASFLAKGELPLGGLEIARLDNDPNFPEHGVLRLDLNGGK